jgi:hypothetical protein
VSFRQGFDLPTNGTVTLRLDGEPAISGNINMKNGTLIINNAMHLNKGATFKDNGFIQSNGFADIVFQKSLIFTNNYIKLIGVIRFLSTDYGVIDFQQGAVLDARTLSRLNFYNCQIFDRGTSILTSLTKPDAWFIGNCSVFAGIDAPTIWLTPNIFFQGSCSIATGTQLKMKKLSLNNVAEATIETGSTLELTELDVRFRQSKFFLNNSTLDFVSSLTTDIMIGATSVSQGRLTIRGKSMIKSSTGNSLTTSPRLTIEVLEGSTLIIPEHTKLILQ